MRKRARSAWGNDGFTLVELLIVIVIVGLIAAVAMTVFLGYARDARAAEAKAIAGSVLKALEGCAQARGSGGACSRADIAQRASIDTTGLTGDGRWAIGTADLAVGSGAVPTLSGTVTVSGVPGRDTDRMAVGMYVGATGVMLRCTTNSLTPPSIASGDAC
jgi:prepilin-type N-terminal cleavage/methylation domain-containing protein